MIVPAWGKLPRPSRDRRFVGKRFRARKVAGSLCLALVPLSCFSAAPMDPLMLPSARYPASSAQRPGPPVSVPPSRTGASSGAASPVLSAVPTESRLARDTSATPLSWGPLRVRPHFDYRLYYATQVYVQPGERQDTVRHSLSPGLLLETAHLSVDYTPTLNYYSKGRFDDGVDHSVALNANAGYGDWRFTIGHEYSKSSQVLIETARQTDTENHTTTLNATYLYSDRISFDFNLNQTIVEASNFNSFRQWSTMNWLNYVLSETTTLGAGLGGGFADVETGSDMTYERVQARLGWEPGLKLSVDLNGGIEIRQFVDGNSDRINPIMGASISYRIFDQTTLALEADRSVNTSLLQDQITENTSVSAGLSQRLFGRLNASLKVGYRTTDYQAASGSLVTDRTDETMNIGLTIGTAFLDRGFASIGYGHLENESSVDGFGFVSDQYTFQIGYRY